MSSTRCQPSIGYPADNWIELGFGGLIGLLGPDYQPAAGQSIVDPTSNIGVGATSGVISGAGGGAVTDAGAGGAAGGMVGASVCFIAGAIFGGIVGAQTDGDPIDVAGDGTVGGAVGDAVGGTIPGPMTGSHVGYGSASLPCFRIENCLWG